MLNKCMIMGRLVRDPELRFTPSQIPTTSFTVAVERDQKEKVTDFIDCIAWNNTAEYICKYGTKGRMVVICGRLQIREWVDKNDHKRRNAEILIDSLYFCDRFQAGDAGESSTGTDDLPF